MRAEQRRRLFPTIEYASRVSHFDPNSDYRDFHGFYILFWIALTIMATTTMLRNIKDTGYPMRVEIWQLFAVKIWELAVADGLMVATTAASLPLHKIFRSKMGKMLGFRWGRGGLVIQSIFQTIWFAFWVRLVSLCVGKKRYPEPKFIQGTFPTAMDLDGPSISHASYPSSPHENALLRIL